MSYMTFPWEQLGRGLRSLSLSGTAGNAVAWIVFAALGALPLAALLFLWHKRRLQKADILLAALSIALFIGLWFFINPAYMDLYLSPVPAGGISKYALAAVIDSLLLTWLLLRGVAYYEKMTHGKLFACLRLLLDFYALLLAVGVLWQEGSSFRASCASLQESNTASPSSLVSVSIFFLALQAANGLLPDMAQIALMLMLGSFLGSFGKDAFGQEALGKMEGLQTASRRLLVLVLSVNVGCNILQLLFSRFLLSSFHRLPFPLSELIVLLGVRTLSYLYLESRRLKEDNDMFI